MKCIHQSNNTETCKKCIRNRKRITEAETRMREVKETLEKNFKKEIIL